MNKQFFNEQAEQSLVKSTIVSKYFWVWAKVILSSLKKRHNPKIAYIDLFAGPGRYENGASSTPIMVLEKAISDSDLSNSLITIFNDKDEKNYLSLEKAISEIPNIEKLKNKPSVLNNEIGVEIVNQFEKMKLIPTLLFVDPWGYKGLSLRLVESVLKDWGCDCIFFFNYNRISMGLTNDLVKEHMDALFGEECAKTLRVKIQNVVPSERELILIEELCQTLKGNGNRFVLPFRFRNKTGKRTSHHLIFVSKHFKGYEIMKEIMASESSEINQGVATFEYNPAAEQQPLLFELSRPIEDLEEMLLKEYAGKDIKMFDIYCEHNIGKKFIKKNYKDVLKKLKIAGKITTNPVTFNPKTFPDNVIVSFPKKQQFVSTHRGFKKWACLLKFTDDEPRRVRTTKQARINKTGTS